MRKLVLLFIAAALFSCKKEATYGPLKLKNGQEVDLLVDHRYGADQDILLQASNRKSAEAYLSGFDNREPGYNYKVRAKFHYEENPPADGPAFWYDFIKVESKEQYKGDEAFTVPMIVSYVPGGPVIRLNKTGSNYYFVPDKLQFTYADNTVKAELEEIWANVEEVRNNRQLPKWKAIKATVTHDPSNFGKAYLVKQIEFTP